jgi:hypothetical protein
MLVIQAMSPVENELYFAKCPTKLTPSSVLKKISFLKQISALKKSPFRKNLHFEKNLSFEKNLTSTKLSGDALDLKQGTNVSQTCNLTKIDELFQFYQRLLVESTKNEKEDGLQNRPHCTTPATGGESRVS